MQSQLLSLLYIYIYFFFFSFLDYSPLFSIVRRWIALLKLQHRKRGVKLMKTMLVSFLPLNKSSKWSKICCLDMVNQNKMDRESRKGWVSSSQRYIAIIHVLLLWNNEITNNHHHKNHCKNALKKNKHVRH